MAARDCPGEYVLTGHLDAITNAGGPQDFTMTDLIAIAGVDRRPVRRRRRHARCSRRWSGSRPGPSTAPPIGDQVWAAFREQNDPEAVLTLHNGQSFPYGAATPARAGVAMPDAGTAHARADSSTTRPGRRRRRGHRHQHRSPSSLGGLTARQTATGACPTRRWSPAANSATGHPVAVFGPQTGYFAPQLLMLQELQGPGISSRGVAFSGLNLYTLIGRGPDYAWSATSAVQDITDTFAVAALQHRRQRADHGLRPATSTTASACAMESLAKTELVDADARPTPPPPAPTG